MNMSSTLIPFCSLLLGSSCSCDMLTKDKLLFDKKISFLDFNLLIPQNNVDISNYPCYSGKFANLLFSLLHLLLRDMIFFFIRSWPFFPILPFPTQRMNLPMKFLAVGAVFVLEDPDVIDFSIVRKMSSMIIDATMKMVPIHNTEHTNKMELGNIKYTVEDMDNRAVSASENRVSVVVGTENASKV